MNVDVKLTTRSINATAANFHAANAALQDTVKGKVREYGNLTKRRVQARVRVDTQYMHDHTEVRFTEQGYGYEVGWWEEQFVGQQGYDGSIITQFYPIYQEFGTRFMSANPALFGANEEIRPEFLADLSQSLSEAARGLAISL